MCKVPCLAILVAVLLGASMKAFSQAPPFRVLAFYTEQTEGDHVAFAHQAIKYFAAQAERESYRWTATTDWNLLLSQDLQQYRVVVWLDDEPHTPAQREAFERYMEHGGGWLGFHASAYNDASSGWPWFVQFLGGAVFYSNNWPPLPAKLNVEAEGTAITKGIPKSFTSPSNEWYVWKPDPRDDKDVKVLVSLDPSNYPLGLKDVLLAGDLPVMWTNTRYRMVYSNMGHGDRIFDSPVQNRLLLQALLSLGREKDARTPASR